MKIDDLQVMTAIELMRRRRGGERLLAYKAGRSWAYIDASRVNAYLKGLVGDELTAKDFRTWHATVIAAAALAASPEPGDTVASRKRAVRSAMVEVSTYLGNTPTIARSSYIDPRVIDLYEDGVTIAAALRRRYRTPADRQVGLERAVLRLISQAPEGGVGRPGPVTDDESDWSPGPIDLRIRWHDRTPSGLSHDQGVSATSPPTTVTVMAGSSPPLCFHTV